MRWPLHYDPVGDRPAKGEQPGTRALLTAILQAYPMASNLGIFNPRDIAGNKWPHVHTTLSIHAEGRAGDAGFGPDEKADGDRLAAALVARAGDLGVQEVIWYQRIWTPGQGWHAYRGRSTHKDHVHTSQHWLAARTLTLDEARRVLTAPAAVPVTPPQQEDDLMAPAPKDTTAIVNLDGGGWYRVEADGGVFTDDDGKAPFLGSLFSLPEEHHHLPAGVWIAALAVTAWKGGKPAAYRLVTNRGNGYDLPA